MTERERYEMLCRGEIPMPLSLQKDLRCRYVDRGIPFLKIAPFKEEEAYLDPRIVIYHDVIYDEEIETIKRMAQPRVSDRPETLYSFYGWLQSHSERDQRGGADLRRVVSANAPSIKFTVFMFLHDRLIFDKRNSVVLQPTCQ
jgi:hypothetical protein